MKLWICGQLKGQWDYNGSIWEFQGVFSSEELADRACRNESYFYFPATLDEEFPDESFLPSEYNYPRSNN